MRLFISINFNEETIEDLVNLQAELRGCGIDGNYTKPENLHLTLAFIGEYGNPDEVMEAIENVEFRTIHAAKGLEADYVIIIQVINDWLGFPNKLSPFYFHTFIQGWGKDDKFEEERRLFYVALTRAKYGVTLIGCKIYGISPLLEGAVYYNHIEVKEE